MKNKTFTIRIDGDYMLYDFHHGEVVDSLTWDETLHRILTQKGFSPFLDDGRIRFTDRDNSKYRIADLAIACYSGHITSFETWKEDMQKYLDTKHNADEEVDHADSNCHNNTLLNLSLMDSSLNRIKNSIVARFKLPVIVNTAYVDNEYRLQVVWTNLYASGHFHGINIDSPCSCSLNLLCTEADTFVDCLQRLSTLDSDWSYPAKENGKWNNRENGSWCSSIENSLRAQSILAGMDRKEFDIYHNGGLDTYLKLINKQL